MEKVKFVFNVHLLVRLPVSSDFRFKTFSPVFAVRLSVSLDFLPVCGESACLVRADGGGVAHRLAGVQVAHQVVVAHHFLPEIILSQVNVVCLETIGTWKV